MNTIYGLAVLWRRYLAHVELDTEELFIVHRSDYDFERNLATVKITGFRQEGGSWQRIDEEHQERRYTLEKIKEALKCAGLHELACWGSLKEMSEPKPDSGRVFFVARR